IGLHQVFRMPLHSQNEGMADAFHPFNHPVLRLGTGDEPRCRLSNGLVMETVHLDGRAPRDSVQQRTLRHFHRMGKVGTGGLLLMLMQIFPLPVQILEHVSSGGHVQNLAPPADGQDRLSLLQHPPDEEDLQMISSRIDPTESGNRFLAEPGGIDVPAPGQQQPVDPLRDLPNRLVPLHIRDNQRKPPCPQDGLQIFPAHRQRSPFIPGSGHSDDRPAHALPPPRRNRPKARSAVPRWVSPLYRYAFALPISRRRHKKEPSPAETVLLFSLRKFGAAHSPPPASPAGTRSSNKNLIA